MRHRARTIARRILTFFCVLVSSLLLILFSWLAFQSHWDDDQLAFYVGTSRWVLLQSGTVGLEVTTRNHQTPDGDRATFAVEHVGHWWEIHDGVQSEHSHTREAFTGPQFLGFRYATQKLDESYMSGVTADGTPIIRGSKDVTQRWMTIPYWFLIGLTLVIPCRVLFVTLRRRARRAGGRCIRCGYDLRASGNRCTECGWDRTSAREGQSALRLVAQVGGAIIVAAIAMFSLHLRLLPPYQPTGRVPLQTKLLPFLPKWVCATGTDPARMRRAGREAGLEEDEALSLWSFEGNERALVVTAVGTVMFNEFLGVVAMDRSPPHVVRQGSVPVIPGSTPYALVEFRSDDATVPAAHRGVWHLGIAYWPDKEPYAPTEPVVLKFEAAEEQNVAMIAPVLWDDVPDTARDVLVGILKSPAVRFRSAEPARSGQAINWPTTLPSTSVSR